jgi:hypothetical protein
MAGFRISGSFSTACEKGPQVQTISLRLPMPPRSESRWRRTLKTEIREPENVDCCSSQADSIARPSRPKPALLRTNELNLAWRGSQAILDLLAGYRLRNAAGKQDRCSLRPGRSHDFGTITARKLCIHEPSFSLINGRARVPHPYVGPCSPGFAMPELTTKKSPNVLSWDRHSKPRGREDEFWHQAEADSGLKTAPILCRCLNH